MGALGCQLDTNPQKCYVDGVSVTFFLNFSEKDFMSDHLADATEISPLLHVKNLKMHFPIKSQGGGQFIRAVDGVDLAVPAGTTLSLVGESGCGKTTVGRIIAQLLKPTDGSITFEGRNVTGLHGNDLRKFRPNVQMVFQDPYTSLNPRLTAEKIIAEPLHINRRQSSEIRARVTELLEAVGLSSAQGKRLPQKFSGGQRQRIAIARALALEPKLVVCDEPVSALDMSIQAKILNLLVSLQQSFQLTYFFISHDLSVVRLVSDRVAVMYLGKIVETSDTQPLFEDPLHPYTQSLIAAIPDPYDRKGVVALRGEVPSNVNPPRGCHFHTRCPAKMAVCEQRVPALKEIAPQRRVACFLHHDDVESDAA